MPFLALVLFWQVREMIAGEQDSMCLLRPSSLAVLGLHSTAAWYFAHKLRTGRKDLFLFFLGHPHTKRNRSDKR